MEGKRITLRVLIAGSGPAEPSWEMEWNRQGYQVLRLDIDPRNAPDFCGSMTQMGEIGQFEAVYCCHALEHLYPHEVPQALAEFYRVLAPSGYAVIMVPDLEDVRPTEEPLNMKIPLTGLHLYYGDSRQIPDYPHMAHHCGFIQETLTKAMKSAGFSDVSVKRAAEYNLIATGKKC